MGIMIPCHDNYIPVRMEMFLKISLTITLLLLKD